MISIENLDVFRETYGFVASDDVLRAVGLMIRNAVRDLGNPQDFIGHNGPAEFLVVTDQAVSSTLNERITTRLRQSLEYFYPLKDRVDNFLVTNQLSLRINIVDSSQRSFKNLEQFRKALIKQ